MENSVKQQLKWLVGFSPIQGFDNVDMYYKKFCIWKQKLVRLNYHANEESYVEDFIKWLQWDIYIRVYDYRSQLCTMSDALAIAFFDETMLLCEEEWVKANLKVEENKVFEELPKPSSVEEMQTQGTVQVLDDDGNSKTILQVIDTEELEDKDVAEFEKKNGPISVEVHVIDPYTINSLLGEFMVFNISVADILRETINPIENYPRTSPYNVDYQFHEILKLIYDPGGGFKKLSCRDSHLIKGFVSIVVVLVSDIIILLSFSIALDNQLGYIVEAMNISQSDVLAYVTLGSNHVHVTSLRAIGLATSKKVLTRDEPFKRQNGDKITFELANGCDQQENDVVLQRNIARLRQLENDNIEFEATMIYEINVRDSISGGSIYSFKTWSLIYHYLANWGRLFVNVSLRKIMTALLELLRNTHLRASDIRGMSDSNRGALCNLLLPNYSISTWDEKPPKALFKCVLDKAIYCYLLTPYEMELDKTLSGFDIKVAGPLHDNDIYQTKDFQQPSNCFVINISELFGFTQGCQPLSRWNKNFEPVLLLYVRMDALGYHLVEDNHVLALLGYVSVNYHFSNWFPSMLLVLWKETQSMKFWNLKGIPSKYSWTYFINMGLHFGFPYDWIETCMLQEDSYKWNNILGLVCLSKYPEILCNETFEKLGTIGNLLVFLSTIFNMKSITVTSLLHVSGGTCNFGTMVSAFWSNTYWRHYTMLSISSIGSFMGMLAPAVPLLHHSTYGENNNKCVGLATGQLAFLLNRFELLVIGVAGTTIKCCHFYINTMITFCVSFGLSVAVGIDPNLCDQFFNQWFILMEIDPIIKVLKHNATHEGILDVRNGNSVGVFLLNPTDYTMSMRCVKQARGTFDIKVDARLESFVWDPGLEWTFIFTSLRTRMLLKEGEMLGPQLL